jgi:hypothetical protein
MATLFLIALTFLLIFVTNSSIPCCGWQQYISNSLKACGDYGVIFGVLKISFCVYASMCLSCKLTLYICLISYVKDRDVSKTDKTNNLVYVSRTTENNLQVQLVPSFRLCLEVIWGPRTPSDKFANVPRTKKTNNLEPSQHWGFPMEKTPALPHKKYEIPEQY